MKDKDTKILEEAYNSVRSSWTDPKAVDLKDLTRQAFDRRGMARPIADEEPIADETPEVDTEKWNTTSQFVTAIDHRIQEAKRLLNSDDNVDDALEVLGYIQDKINNFLMTMESGI